MTRSLRKSLLLWLLLPAALAIITFLPLAYHLVHQPAMEALDQALADASLALVPHLEVVDGEPRFVFPPAAEQVLRTDRVDDIYYLILGPNNRFIAGDAGLPHEAGPDDEVRGERTSFDSHFRGHRVRVTAIHRTIADEPFIFVTAETTRKRDQLKLDLAVALLLPLMFFAVATGITIWFGVHHALLPVEGIRRALHGMEHRALQPLDESAAPIEIRPLVTEFNQVLDRLEQAAEAQQRFVANAAHQLRTPLAGIRTQLELLQREPDATERDARTRHCVGAIERLGHLINQMLVLLSAEPGGRHTSLAATVDLPELIRDRSPEWIRLAEARNLDLGFELQAARVNGDRLLLGVGKDAIADGSAGDGRFAWYQGVKVSVIDVANPAAPREAARQVIGRRGTDATVLRDHHGIALQTVGNTVRIGLPVRLNDTPPSWMTGAPSDYYGFTRTELQRLEVNLETSTLTARKPIPSKLAEERDIGNDRALLWSNQSHWFQNSTWLSAPW